MFKAFGKDGWIDERIEFKDWPALKPKAPLGFVPTLTLPDGRVISQTDAMARWAAKKCGLYPTDNDDEALVVDEVCCTVIEALNKTPRSEDADEMKRLREEYAAGFLTTAVKQLESRVSPGP